MELVSSCEPSGKDKRREVWLSVVSLQTTDPRLQNNILLTDVEQKEKSLIDVSYWWS